MRTLLEMTAALAGNLERENLSAPGTTRLVQLLNTAKTQVAALRDRFDPNWSVKRKDYTVTQGLANVSLPDGTTADAPWRRLLGACVVEDSGSETKVNLYEYGDDAEKDWGSAGFYLVREGADLYFDTPGGAPRALTLRVRYAAFVADLDDTDLTKGFVGLAADWVEAIVTLATVLGLPAAGKGGQKWAQIWQAQAELLKTAACAALDQPLTVRRNESW